MLLTLFVSSLILAHFLVIWFKTNALFEYLNLFKINIFGLEVYKETTNSNNWLYLEFLKQYYEDIFFVRLISCPICISTWLALPISFFTALLCSSIKDSLFFFGTAFFGLVWYNLYCRFFIDID